MPEPETPDEVLDAIENGPRGDLGRLTADEPIVYDAIANVMRLVRREEGTE